jgi:hypothetical protein
MTAKPPSQLDKFKEAARDLECDDDPERFRERVGKLVKHKPVPEKGGQREDE